MTEFEQLIRPYPSLWSGYEDATTVAIKERHSGLVGEGLDLFLSRNCRAFFFHHHLKVEREMADQEVRDVNKSSIVPFHLSPVQLKLLDLFEGRMRTGRKFRQRVMKCRRARVSTIYLAIAYHICRFGQNKKGLVFTDRLETSRKLRRILDIFYQTDDLLYKPEIGKRTLAEGLYLHQPGAPKEVTERDSFILLGSGEQRNAGVGGSLDFMVWSEAALTPDAETHWTTISPSLQGAIFDIAESTPSMTGQDSIIFPEFESPSENCDAAFLSWLDIPEYRLDDKAAVETFVPYLDHHLYGKEMEIITEFNPTPQQMLWRRFKLDELKNLNAFKQVFPISKEEAFYASAGLFFHKALIDMTKPKVAREVHPCLFSDQGVGVSVVYDSSGSWKLFSPVSIESNYLITADTAEGKCADRELRDPDYSVAIVWKLSSRVEEVAFFRERIPPEVFAEQISVAARYFNTALVMPERTGAGLATLVRLRQLYSSIYREQKYTQGSFVMTQEFGFMTSSATKLHALSCLLSRIRDPDKGVEVHSDVVRKEMEKFAQQGVKFGALPGAHDDCVTNLWLMAMCLFQMPNLIRPREVSDGQIQSGVGSFKPVIERENSWQYESSDARS